MKDLMVKIKESATKEIENAASVKALEEIKVKYLGKKGELTERLKDLKNIDPEQRPALGQLINTVKAELEDLFGQRFVALHNFMVAQELKKQDLDVTIPGRKQKIGARHPLKATSAAILEIFATMGFEVVFGPEIEWDKYNFDMLNMPKNHPAREESDTFFVESNLALRTQTSSVQARYMETHTPPIRIVSPGRVYRIDEIDSTHSPMFHQIEGLIVERGTNMGHLKYVLENFAKAFYGPEVKTRFRPHHFQFTEPSAEMDMSCFGCKGEGCRICKGEGWIELLGCGMVHPKVLSICGIDPEQYSGLAFGIGLDRAAMQKRAIDNMKLLFENDIRFLRQF